MEHLGPTLIRTEWRHAATKLAQPSVIQCREANPNCALAEPKDAAPQNGCADRRLGATNVDRANGLKKRDPSDGTYWTNQTIGTILHAVITEASPMHAAHARRTAAHAPTKMASPAAADLIGLFVQRNPTSNRGELVEVGKLVAAFSATAAKLSPAARKRLIAHKVQFEKLIAEIADEPAGTAEPFKLVAKSAAEVSQGAGLGQPLSAEEGRARLGTYATPARVEDWAGRLAGPTELERDFGVARSTLHAWQKQGAVVGLLVGVRKHAFPTEQFVDGRPVVGLGAIVEAIGEPRTAWLWLREPNPRLAGATPLARLKAGAIDKVVEVARLNFAGA